MTHQRRLLLCAPLLLTVAAGSAAEIERVNFTRDIRPILSDACYECHGPSAKDRKAELRLDIRAEALAERDGNPAIVAGDPLASALVQRISSTDAEERMPPADAARQLTAEEIRKIRAWIEQGADWENLWSLTPVEQTPLPAVIKTAWPRNGLDYFVLQRLEESGLQPSPEADRATLIRRLTLDLTGLPPTLEEIDAFLGDTNPDAYEKLVERLLASPHYGERDVPRMARCGTLCRHPWLPRRFPARNVALAGLGDQRLQSQHAV